MEGRAVNRISVLARLDMEVKLATSVSKLKTCDTFVPSLC